jgi:ferredoxin
MLCRRLLRTAATRVRFVFVNADKSETEVTAEVGTSLLEVARANKVDLEGACESSMACSTCHVILDSPIYSQLPQACADEEDMLDLAFGLTPTSRLGCQVKVAEYMEGTKVRLPAATRNLYVDGFKPSTH